MSSRSIDTTYGRVTSALKIGQNLLSVSLPLRHSDLLSSVVRMSRFSRGMLPKTLDAYTAPRLSSCTCYPLALICFVLALCSCPEQMREICLSYRIMTRRTSAPVSHLRSRPCSLLFSLCIASLSACRVPWRHCSAIRSSCLSCWKRWRTTMSPSRCTTTERCVSVLSNRCVVWVLIHLGRILWPSSALHEPLGLVLIITVHCF